MITTLIDKQDNFEVIRDEIASILAFESTNQQALAVSEAKDPANWKLRVYSERSNPWEAFRNDDSDNSPIINVWYDSSNFDKSASNVMERQKTVGIFNIDCIGRGQAEDDGATGQILGDEEAAYEVQRALRLVRNILMASEYTYLGLRGTVWGRWPQSITSFQPPQESTVEQISGARIALEVTFNEFSPQYQAEVLDLLSAKVHRLEDGQIVINADYDYTA